MFVFKWKSQHFIELRINCLKTEKASLWKAAGFQTLGCPWWRWRTGPHVPGTSVPQGRQDTFQWILECELRSCWGRRERLVLWEYLTSRLHVYWGMKKVYQDNNDDKKMLKLRPYPPQMCRCQPDREGDEGITFRRWACSHFYLRTSRCPSCTEQINS